MYIRVVFKFVINAAYRASTQWAITATQSATFFRDAPGFNIYAVDSRHLCYSFWRIFHMLWWSDWGLFNMLAGNPVPDYYLHFFVVNRLSRYLELSLLTCTFLLPNICRHYCLSHIRLVFILGIRKPSEMKQTVGFSVFPKGQDVLLTISCGGCGLYLSDHSAI